MSGQSSELVRDEVLALLQATPPTEAELDVAGRYFLGEATDDELRNAIAARIQRALDKRPYPPVPSGSDCTCGEFAGTSVRYADCPVHCTPNPPGSDGTS